MAKELEQFDDKESFLKGMETLRPDLFFPEAWTDEQKAAAVEMVRPARLRTGMFASIPLRCEAERCVFAEVCPLLAQNLAPKGKPCPIEMGYVQMFMDEYMAELGVDRENLIEVSMVRDLVDQEIQQMRKTWTLSMEHFIQENVMGVDDQGQPIMKKELHLAVDLEDRLMRRKKDLRNQLLATRESRAKAGQATLDTAQAISKVLNDLDRRQSAKEEALAKKLGREFYDDYIDAEDAEVIDGEG